MAKTLSYVQEHGYNTVEDAEGKLAEIKELASSSRKELKDIEGRLRQVNEQIHYTGQYLANKSIYSQFLRSKNKGQFRQEHSSELAIYETAVKFLKEKAGDGQLPTLQTLKAEKEKLLVQKKKQRRNIITIGIIRKNWIPSVAIFMLPWGSNKVDRYGNRNGMIYPNCYP